jgi:hypothetical protein
VKRKLSNVCAQIFGILEIKKPRLSVEVTHCVFNKDNGTHRQKREVLRDEKRFFKV